MTLAAVAELLACPACASREVADSPLSLVGTSLRCPHQHAYDVARQGYVNLLGRAVPRNADTPEMVAARERFLGTGAYDAVATALTDAALRWVGPRPAVLDVGAGPGFYLVRVLAGFGAQGRPGRGLALDVSPAACRRAARSGDDVGAAVADAWERWPVRTASVDVGLSVFAPRRPDELARVLVPDGLAVVVSPLPDHLAGLRRARGLLDVEPGKQERLSATLGEHLEPVGEVDVRYSVTLDSAAVRDLVAMGPNAFHRGEDGHAAEPDQPPEADVEVGVAVRVSSWRRPG